jgi:hypothetical protein
MMMIAENVRSAAVYDVPLLNAQLVSQYKLLMEFVAAYPTILMTPITLTILMTQTIPT